MTEQVQDRKVNFTPTAEQLADVYRLSMRRQLAKGIWRLIFVMVLLSALLSLVVETEWQNRMLYATLVSIGAMILVGIIVAVRYASLPKIARRIFDQQKLLQETVTINWSETNWRAQTAHALTNIPWYYFVDVAEDDKVIMLYQSMVLFNFIPKSILSPEQCADIVALAKAGIAQQPPQ